MPQRSTREHCDHVVFLLRWRRQLIRHSRDTYLA